MTATVESIVTQALLLSAEERGIIVDRLAESMQSENDLSDEMKSTLDRRWEDIESGKVQCIPHKQVMQQLRGKYGA